jgi:hypothetical protein
MMGSIGQLEQAIRDRINRPRLNRLLLSDRRQFEALCSALDTIGDVETGLDTYLSMNDPGDIGYRYILIYGLLQMLVVEQNAVIKISRIFSVASELPPEVEDIREIRNYSIGHPVPNRTSKPAGFISRSQMTLKSIKVMICWPDGRTEFRTIDLFDLINLQRCILSEILQLVLDDVNKRELDHRKKFRDEKLAEIFHPSLSWLVSKLGATTAPEHKIARGVDLQFVGEMIDNFAAALEQRGRIDAAYPILEDLRYPIEKLSAYYADTECEQLDFPQADIYAFFIADRISILQKIAAEIDAEYTTDDLSA